MVRHTAMVAFVAYGAFGFSRDPGCGGADSPAGGPNAPCTRSRDCTSNLVCMEGVCTDPDAGIALPDAGRGATSSGDAAGDGG